MYNKLILNNQGVAKLMKIAIIGATGYGGAELIRILHQHPAVELHSVHSTSQQGSQIAQTYPHLNTVINHTLEDIDIKKLATEVDLVFLGTPSGVASTLVPKLLTAGLKVIDLSGDYRLKDPQKYETWYKLPFGDKETLDQAIYGLTEWCEQDIRNRNFISNPGCFPTAVLLGLGPLVNQHQIDENSIIIDAKTGVSGAGRGNSSATHFSETNENFKIYKVNEHQHIPEIEQTLIKWNQDINAVTFSTHLVPMTRGIMATMYITLKEQTSTQAILQSYKQHYASHYFVRVREDGTFPSTKEVSGSNFCDISLTYDERTNRVTVVSVIDNLMKGAAGQAVQNMNHMLGIDEKTGLEFVPVYP